MTMRRNKKQKIEVLQNILLKPGAEEDFEYVPSTPVDAKNMGTPVFSDMAEDQAYYDKFVLPFSKEIQRKLMREEREKVTEQLNVGVGSKRQLEDLILSCATFDDISNKEYQEVINLCRNLRNVINSARKQSDEQMDNRFENLVEKNIVTESFSNEQQVRTGKKGLITPSTVQTWKKAPQKVKRLGSDDSLKRPIQYRPKARHKQRNDNASSLDNDNPQKPVRRSGRVSVKPVKPKFYAGQIEVVSTTQRRPAQERKSRAFSPTDMLSKKSINEVVLQLFNLTNKSKKAHEGSFTDSSLEESNSFNAHRRLYSEDTWINSKQFESICDENLDIRKEILHLLHS